MNKAEAAIRNTTVGKWVKVSSDALKMLFVPSANYWEVEFWKQRRKSWSWRKRRRK